MKNYFLILMVVFGMSSCSSYNDMDVAIETPEDSKSKNNVYNQTQVTQKFGRRSNLDQIQIKQQSQKETNSFIIDTDRIYSVEEENYHSLTYLVAYPDKPERIVNLIFFSTDYKNYHPAIVEYNLSPDEVVANRPIERDKINVIPIRPGEDYMKTLGNGTRIGLDGCVIVIVEAIGGKCESGQHGPGEPCDYAGGPGAAKVSYRIIYDFSNCDDDDTGGGSSGGTPPSSGYPGGVNPTNPGAPPAGYQPPYFGGGPGSWIPSQPVKTVPWWPFPGRIDVIIFKTGLNADQKQWWNDNIESPQRAGIFKYVSEGGDHAFAAWAIDYFIENPNTSWKTFVNWFLTKPEGKDYKYDPDFWEDPNLTFQQQNLPTWAAYSAAYPDDLTKDLYVKIGGDVAKAQKADPLGTENGCALKQSYALNYSGVVIPNIPTTGKYYGTVQGADGKYYFLNAESMIAWMKKTFGTTNNPNYIYRHLDDYQGVDNQYGNGFKNDLLGKKGIFSMLPIDKDEFEASGHLDIFNGEECKKACYFPYMLEFHFWELH